MMCVGLVLYGHNSQDNPQPTVAELETTHAQCVVCWLGGILLGHGRASSLKNVLHLCQNAARAQCNHRVCGCATPRGGYTCDPFLHNSSKTWVTPRIRRWVAAHTWGMCYKSLSQACLCCRVAPANPGTRTHCCVACQFTGAGLCKWELEQRGLIQLHTHTSALHHTTRLDLTSTWCVRCNAGGVRLLNQRHMLPTRYQCESFLTACPE